MMRGLRFVIALVAGLAALTWGASVLVTRTTHRWFDIDARGRAELAVNGARLGLVEAWTHAEPQAVGRLLTDIARDERILGAEACQGDLTGLAVTADFPRSFGCARLAARLPPLTVKSPVWTTRSELSTGLVYVAAVPLIWHGDALGWVVLVQDLSWTERREQQTTLFLAGAFGILAFLAALLTLVANRLSWRHWTNELRRLVRGGLLRGGNDQPAFRPLLRDVRDLAGRIAADQEADPGGQWTAAKLRQTLAQHLEGEKVLIVANREPYIHERGEDGAVRVRRPASGLVTALEPVMRSCSGVWVAHGSGSADRETSDKDGRVPVPPANPEYVLKRVWLSEEEERRYYYGFCNEGLWPLCHIAHTRPTFRASDFEQYERVNRRFADAVCAEADRDDPIILVQDYHFALAPRFIREKLPGATILTFWHIPWPNSEQFGICPFREALLEGLLGSSIIGFHTRQHCNNFLEAVDRYLEARIDREDDAVVLQGDSTLVRPYPISIEWPSHLAREAPPVAECRQQIFQELGLAPDALLGVGVDRLDYTKGIEERLLAVEEALVREPRLQRRFTFVQLAAPSRSLLETYRQLDDRVQATAERINLRFGTGRWKPVSLLRGHHEPERVFRFYRAANVCYVSSLHDGMNLVAKEFVAARDDEQGVLVLSRFTGAARELTEALIVNPYDLSEAASALAFALKMSPQEQRSRMRALRSFVGEYNVYRWAGRMIVDAARLRRRGRSIPERMAKVAGLAR